MEKWCIGSLAILAIWGEFSALKCIHPVWFGTFGFKHSGLVLALLRGISS